ncbi:MAG: flavodoxin-dependent (E)-4-hydroxy-3-methylbut-2-enyl-diphosphate synthase [Bacillota bacterium]|jgi:(E)-4-hydroxy-3-methylbut-2-enyl-diphosphate synthase|nr:flavodoxin-dependent (E)-4-hydroxy-3-methylbut-2-enyl-diphosphate synthase [Bacillota bacterium]
MNDISRRKNRNTRKVKVGNLYIGGDAPISVQSMTNTNTRDTKATISQIHALEKEGCDIVRVAVPNIDAALSIKEIKKSISIPLVADIHFDYRLAIKAIEMGADKIRINPGNIGSAERVKSVVSCANERGIPIRVGVNAGSLEKRIAEKYGGITPEALVESAENHIGILEDIGFYDIVVSIKSSNVPLMIAAYELISEKTEYPLHIGVTEAGTPYRGTIKSAVGIGALLSRGIGDTIRVSLTADPSEEVRAGKEILKSLGLYRYGPEFISCPTCGRTRINLVSVAEQVEKALEGIEKPLKIAVMGCEVNGPGEAKEADIGIAGGDGCALLFKKGEIIRKISEEKIVEELINEINNM